MSGKHSKSDQKGLWIPAEILRDPRLTNSGKILLAEILALHQNGSGCFASNAHLASVLGMTISGLRKQLAKLVDDGFLERGVILTGHVQKRALVPKWGTPLPESGHPPALNGATYKTKNTTDNKTKEARPESLEMVLEVFTELNRGDEAEKFWNHYEANGWVQGGNKPIKNWKAAARQWLIRSEKWNNERKGFNSKNWNGNSTADFMRNG